MCVDWRDCSKTRDGDIRVVASISRPPVKIDRNRDKFPGVNPSDEDQLHAFHANIIRVSVFMRTWSLSRMCIPITIESAHFHSTFKKTV
jgi:hypothetical protein